MRHNLTPAGLAKAQAQLVRHKRKRKIAAAVTPFRNPADVAAFSKSVQSFTHKGRHMEAIGGGRYRNISSGPNAGQVFTIAPDGMHVYENGRKVLPGMGGLANRSVRNIPAAGMPDTYPKGLGVVGRNMTRANNTRSVVNNPVGKPGYNVTKRGQNIERAKMIQEVLNRRSDVSKPSGPKPMAQASDHTFWNRLTPRQKRAWLARQRRRRSLRSANPEQWA